MTVAGPSLSRNLVPMFGASARLIEPSILDRDDPDDPGEIAAFCCFVGPSNDAHDARLAIFEDEPGRRAAAKLLPHD